MTLQRRLEKLEGKRGGDVRSVKIVIREIVWADGGVVAYHGEALTPTGWKSTMGSAGMGREDFEAQLCAMVESPAKQWAGAKEPPSNAQRVDNWGDKEKQNPRFS